LKRKKNGTKHSEGRGGEVPPQASFGSLRREMRIGVRETVVNKHQGLNQNMLRKGGLIITPEKTLLGLEIKYGVGFTDIDPQKKEKKSSDAL